MKQVILTKCSDIIIGKTYKHDGMIGIAETYKDTIVVKSRIAHLNNMEGSDGFFPTDVIRWGGDVDEVKLLATINN